MVRSIPFAKRGSISLPNVANIDPKVVLIDGAELTELMIDFGLGVTTMAIYEVNRVDSDYFGDD